MVLAGVVACFLETLELLACGEDFLLFDETAVDFCGGDFFFPLRRFEDILVDFSGDRLRSFSVFSSLGGAVSQEQNPMFINPMFI